MDFGRIKSRPLEKTTSICRLAAAISRQSANRASRPHPPLFTIWSNAHFAPRPEDQIEWRLVPANGARRSICFNGATTRPARCVTSSIAHMQCKQRFPRIGSGGGRKRWSWRQPIAKTEQDHLQTTKESRKEEVGRQLRVESTNLKSPSFSLVGYRKRKVRRLRLKLDGPITIK